MWIRPGRTVVDGAEEEEIRIAAELNITAADMTSAGEFTQPGMTLTADSQGQLDDASALRYARVACVIDECIRQ